MLQVHSILKVQCFTNVLRFTRCNVATGLQVVLQMRSFCNCASFKQKISQWSTKTKKERRVEENRCKNGGNTNRYII